MKLSNQNLGLFFTRGLSLEKWDKIGILEREIKPYIELAETFGKITLFTYGGDQDKEYLRMFPDNVEIIPKPKYISSLIYTFLLPFIHRKILKTLNIIKTNQMDGSWAAIITKKLYGAKLVVRCGYEWFSYLESTRSSIFKRFIAYWVERFAYKNADKIIITSADDKHFIIRVFKIAEPKIEVIPNYIDTNKFTPTDSNKEKGRVIFIGRLEPVKNLPNLIDAMAGLDAHLVLIGEGGMRSALEKRTLDKGVKAEFKGRVSQSKLPEELNRSRVFILPSLSEGNPKALLEAMSCGLPCIGTDVKGINSIIRHADNGLLCGTDSKSIHNALVDLLANNEISKRIGTNARKLIVENFSFEKIIEKEKNLYDQILRQGK